MTLRVLCKIIMFTTLTQKLGETTCHEKRRIEGWSAHRFQAWEEHRREWQRGGRSSIRRRTTSWTTATTLASSPTTTAPSTFLELPPAAACLAPPQVSAHIVTLNHWVFFKSNVFSKSSLLVDLVKSILGFGFACTELSKFDPTHHENSFLVGIPTVNIFFGIRLHPFERLHTLAQLCLFLSSSHFSHVADFLGWWCF